jgi:hypothetical protein
LFPLTVGKARSHQAEQDRYIRNRDKAISLQLSGTGFSLYVAVCVLPDKAASLVALLSSLVAVHSPSLITSYVGNLAAVKGLLGKEPQGLL